ncbi:YtzI protein [Bacillus atrophaeus]|uniref:YtzI protein n=1 Tax=Bacillus atrophaeus TaxID=1452 RepID=UPI002DB94698|nr:YtzI protein [Bacillus atrophaeus]MEC2306761.1 YtzI protein [Bacillus atrophaeus]
MLLLMSGGFLIVLAVLFLSIWTTVKAYDFKHTVDSPEDENSKLPHQTKRQ